MLDDEQILIEISRMQREVWRYDYDLCDQDHTIERHDDNALHDEYSNG